VNGQSLRDATHEDAVKALKQAGDVADLEGMSFDTIQTNAYHNDDQQITSVLPVH
jgi:hypothetical protein